ncbi:MAG TPA: hypothetical protein VG324_13250 [Blastocatellia bacterium]|nr:hypothetical protein [Blastocatellia bacterium]
MKRSSLFIIGLLLLATYSISTHGQGDQEEVHRQWLYQRYAEATSIKPAMSRADLLRVFREDGGVQPIPATRYVLKSCNMIKIEVEFDTEYGHAYKKKPDADLKITKVSQPYLTYPAMK